MAGRAGAWRTTGPPALALAVLAVGLTLVGFESGGFFPADYLLLGGVCFIALGVLGVAALPRLRPTNHALVALGTLAGLAGWTALSATWSPLPDEALVDFQRTLTYVGVFALALLAAGTGRHSGLLLWAALTVCVVVVGAGLLQRLYPDLITDTVTRAPGYRLSYPLTYWNAFGGLASLGCVLAAGLASDPRSAAWARALAGTVAVPLAVAMYLSLSRGSWLALIAGTAVLLVVTPYRFSALLTVGVIGSAAVLCLLRLEGLEGLVDEAARGRQEADGRAFGPFLVVASLAAGGALLVIAHVRSRAGVQHLAESVRLRVIAVGAAAVLVVAVTGYALAGDAVEGRSAKGLDKVSDWVSAQWDDFLLTSTFNAGGTERLTTTRGTRSDLYRVAVDGFEAHPLRGDGAGAFQWRWYQAREVQDDTTEPHSLWLGALGELGLVGALLLLGFVGAIAAAARRGLRRPLGLRRGQAAAAASAGAVWVVHSAGDWDWQMPVLTGTALLTAAALLPPGQVKRRRSRAALPGGAQTTRVR